MDDAGSWVEYGPLEAELYDGSGRDEILDLYRSEAEGTAGTVLAAMCGTGDFLVPLVEDGLEVDGVDASQHMLGVLRGRCAAQGIEVKLYRQWMQALDLPRQYGYVFFPDRCFAMIADRDQALACLEAVRRHMLAGGKLVLDVKQPPAVLDGGDIPPAWEQRLTDGSLIKAVSAVQYEDNGRVWRVHTEKEVWRDGRLLGRETFDYRERFYRRGELVGLLENAGFRDLEVKRAYDGGQPGAADGLVLVGYNADG